MGNTQIKINEAIVASTNAPKAVSVSVEVLIMICVVTTLVIVVKYLKKYVKK